MKIKIIIVCHGELAKAIKNSCEMIMGKQENLFAISFCENCSLENLNVKIDEVISDKQKTIALVDIKGGSPFNVCLKKLDENKIEKLFCGVNLPLVIEIINQVNILKKDDLANVELNELIEEIKL